MTLYDTAIIGASSEGILLASKFKTLKNSPYILISKDSISSKNKNLNFLQAEVVFISYGKGIFCLYLNNGERIFARTLVAATGEKTEHVDLGFDVAYSSKAISKLKASDNIIILGDTDTAAKYAIEATKKAGKVIIVTDKIGLSCSDKLADMLAENKKITILGNTKVVSYKDNLATLETFSTIPCSLILYAGKRTADNACFKSPLVTLDENNAIITNENSASICMPLVFAVGSCKTKNKLADIDKIITQIQQIIH